VAAARPGRNESAPAGREEDSAAAAFGGSVAGRDAAGWTALEAGAGMEAEAIIPLDPEALRHWDAATGRWAVEPGRYEIRVGRSVGDLRLAAAIDIES
jgi:beta-glucosidase